MQAMPRQCLRLVDVHGNRLVTKLQVGLSKGSKPCRSRISGPKDGTEDQLCRLIQGPFTELPAKD
jgi:hypothetical protein